MRVPWLQEEKGGGVRFLSIVQSVRDRLGFGGRRQPEPPTHPVDRCPVATRAAEVEQAEETPDGRELEVAQHSSEICRPAADHSQDPTQVDAVKSGRQIQAPRTQFSGHSKEITDLIIGLDFGTLSTRVVVRSPFVAAGRAVPVQWRVRANMPPHFLPVALREDPSGTLTLTSDWTDPEVGKLKTDLMDRPDDATVRARAAAYLGLTLREARNYMLDTEAEAYGSYQIRWALHLGIPSAGYDDDSIKEAFLSVARAAWLLSRRPGPTTLNAAMMQVKGEDNAGAIEDDPDVTGIEVVPEIAALVAGYARSRRRREGLHVIMDVGASTIDICGFGLQGRDGDDQYHLFTALVRRLGIHELHHRRMEAIGSADLKDSVCLPASLSPLFEVPAAGSDYVEVPADRLLTELDSLDNGYTVCCTKALARVLSDLKSRRDPRSPAWKDGLPLFMTGGGSRHGLVTRAVLEVSDRLTSVTGSASISVQPLPTLETLVLARNRPGAVCVVDEGDAGPKEPQVGPSTDLNWGDSDFLAERLGVAHGLSFDRFEIGDITPPHAIDDVPPMPQRKHVEYISKDHV